MTPPGARTRGALRGTAAPGLLCILALAVAWAVSTRADAAGYSLTPASGPAGTVVHFQASGLGLDEAYCLEMDGQVLWLGTPPAAAVDIPFTIPPQTPEGTLAATFFACAHPEDVLAELSFTVTGTAPPAPSSSPAVKPTVTPTSSPSPEPTPAPTPPPPTPAAPLPPAQSHKAFIPGLASD